ncbi:MAG: hypothetical protein ACYS72_05695 [Planctomycetota bacterium]|jgi:beta propeller repeat protein
MMKHQTEIICAVSLLLGLGSPGTAFEVFPVQEPGNLQQRPAVDNGKIVWQQDMGSNGWDIYGVDLLGPDAPTYFIVDDFQFDQEQPALWNDRVVYQDNSYGDWDVYVSDISDANNPASYLITLNEQDYLNDQTNPAIHGNTAVWQDEFASGDWDIVAADITEPNAPSVYLVQLTDEDHYYANQQSPAIYRNRLIWQDNWLGDWDIASADFWLKNTPLDQFLSASSLQQENPAVWGDWVVWQEDFGDGDFDIYAADISDPEDPVEFALVSDTAAQINPDISGHLVVWQDSRNGNWDIYGYNLITRQEFPITTNSADQTNPAISGSLVAWEDSRATPVTIYYTWLDGDVIADCPSRLTGDVNSDCRVDLADYALLAQEWLTCALDPISACTN